MAGVVISTRNWARAADTVLLKRDDPDLAARVVAGETTPNTTALTWGEFVETRLLANYRDEDDIPVRRMRRAIKVLRKE